VSWAAAPLTPSPSGRPASSVGKKYINIQIPNFNIPNSRQNFSNPEFQSNIKH
jgi:hypothetical protein